MKPFRSVGELLGGPGIPPKYEGCSLDNFEGGERFVRFCREYARDLVAGDSGSVFFTGCCGSGKTHLAVGILREAQKEGLPGRTMFVTVPEFIADLRHAISSSKSEKTIFSRLDWKALVVLDDLGAGKISEYAAQSIFLLLDRCYRDGVPTITTSNLSLE